MAIVTKTSRLDIRLSDDEKSIIEKAALINHQSLSSYIISVLTKQAQIDIVNNEMITLSNADRDFILDLLNNPGEPNNSLVELTKLFKWSN